MSLLHALAESLQRAAGAIAPAERAEWSRAMAGEFAAIEDDRRSLAWSAGCLAAALGWRLRAEVVYLLALAAILAGWRWVLWVEMMTWEWPPSTMFWMRLSNMAPLAVVAFALSLYRPGRALLTAFAVVALTEGAAMVQFLEAAMPRMGSHWTSVVWWTGSFLVFNSWPSFAAAGAAWVVANWRTRRSA
jgi:hypothetical protein